MDEGSSDNRAVLKRSREQNTIRAEGRLIMAKFGNGPFGFEPLVFKWEILEGVRLEHMSLFRLPRSHSMSE